MPNLILLDTRIHHHDAIVNAINLANDVHCVLFDGFSSCLDDIRSKIQQLAVPSFASVGLVQHNHNAPFYKMFGTTSQPSTVLDVASRDPSLQSWSETASFLAWLKSAFGVQHFDMMACAIYSNPDWKYVVDTLSQQTGVEIRASTDDTGSADQGGNWFLESHSGADLKTVYFTTEIDNFKGILLIQPWFKPKYTVKSVAPGSVVAWGLSYIGGTIPSDIASKLTHGVVAIYSTDDTFAALKTDGSVVVWGNAGSSLVASQLTSRVVSIYTNTGAFAALKTDGSVVTWGYSEHGGDSSLVASQLTSGVVSVHSTMFAFAALKSNGSVVAWGDSSFGGNLSIVTYDSNYNPIFTSVANNLTSGVVSIYSNSVGFAALKNDGSVVAWGNSSNGGDSSSVASQLTSGVVSIYSTYSAFAALKTDGSVVAWGGSGGDSSSVASQLTGVVSIYPNAGAFAALKTDGSVVTWGGAGGDSSSVASQLTGVVSIHSTYSAFAALKNDGSVVTWGGWGGAGGDSSSVASQLTGVVSIYSTDGAFAALKNDGSVVAWGSPSAGGDSSSVASQLTSGVVAVHSNLYAFTALKSNGSVVVAWGNSTYGGTLTNDVAGQLTSGVVSVNSTFGAFAAIVSSSMPTLTADHFTNADRLLFLSNAQTEHIFAQQFLDQNGNFTISAQQLRNINIKVPTTVGSSSTTSFDIVIPV